MKLGIQYLENYNKEWGLVSSKEGDSGYDLRAAISEPIVLHPGERVTVPNGIKTQLQSGIYGSDIEIQIRPRSGLAAKKGITIVNAPGTVDHCVDSETKVYLLDGSTPTISEVYNRVKQGETIWCYSVNDENGHLSPGKILNAFDNGVRDTLKVIFDEGTEVVCTNEHKFRTYDGNYIKANELKNGDSVSPFNVNIDKDGYMIYSSLKYGHIGMPRRVHRSIYEEYTGEKPEVVHHINEVTNDNRVENLLGLTHKEHYQTHPSHAKFHEWVYTQEGQEHIKGFGERMKYNKKRLERLKNNPNMSHPQKPFSEETKRKLSTMQKEKWSTNPERKEKTRILFENKMREFRESKEDIDRVNMKIQEKTLNRGLEYVLYLVRSGIEVNEFNYEHNKKTYKEENGLHELPKWKRLVEKKDIQKHIKDNFNHKVLKVERCGKRHVYDLEVEKYHNYVANGIFVHNCYRGEIMTILLNTGKEDFVIEPGDRVSQMVVCPIYKPEIVELKEVNETNRGNNGFGSSGVK